MSATTRDLWRKAKKALRLLGDAKYRRGLRLGVAASIEHRSALEGLDLKTIVDVGANIGQFSLFAWSRFPRARIHSFEPQEAAAAVFLRLFPKDAPVTLHRSAVGIRSGHATMHVSRRGDSSSLLPISRAQREIFPGTDEVGTTTVPVEPLRAFLPAEAITAPALLKIDVQGSELEVLMGCAGLLEQFQYIYVELSFVELYSGQALCHDVVIYLDCEGYRLTGVYNVRLDRRGKAVQADFLFTRHCGIEARGNAGAGSADTSEPARATAGQF